MGFRLVSPATVVDPFTAIVVVFVGVVAGCLAVRVVARGAVRRGFAWWTGVSGVTAFGEVHELGVHAVAVGLWCGVVEESMRVGQYISEQ